MELDTVKIPFRGSQVMYFTGEHSDSVGRFRFDVLLEVPR